jgi:hypothetical protein
VVVFFFFFGDTGFELRAFQSGELLKGAIGTKALKQG